MLQNELYQLISAEGSGENFEVRVRLLPQSVVYAAHFPGMPVTPGACLVQMACELVSEICGSGLDACGASDIRFLHTVLPDETDELMFRLEGAVPADGPATWTVQIFAADVLCARLKLSLHKTS